jgi:hypothetical protein
MGRDEPTSLWRFAGVPVLEHVVEQLFHRVSDVRLIKDSIQAQNSSKGRCGLFLVGK